MNKTDGQGDRPTRIGPYRILDVLGEGGMAIVYLAEQSEPVKRQVAVKILKLGMDTEQVVARFEFERQALAVLDHPNIQKVFDGGATDSGRMYFVTEVVRGVPITEYCDSNRLTTAERLNLFTDVCGAVQHAHQKGVIHRDLKPSNILVGVVDNQAQVKVIDFGIAKAVGGTGTDQDQFTRIGQFVGTPQYMSPEQAGATGLDVDTRTDIFSLGVVLYELLVGALPVDLSAVPDDVVPYALREQEPSNPSARLTELGDASDAIASSRRSDVATLRRQLQGDLDWVVMKAMEKDRTRRYETANALAKDCERFLRHEPVVARPPSSAYLLQRFVRRNRGIVVAGTVAMLAIIAGAGVATVGMLRALEAQEQAETARDSTNRVVDAMIDLIGDTYATLIRTSESLRTIEDTDVLQNEPLRHILNRTETLVARTLVDQPGASVHVMRLQGTTNFILGRYEDSQAQLEAALDRTREAGLHLEQIRLLLDLADLLNAVADLPGARRYLEQARSLDAFATAPIAFQAEASVIAGQVEANDNRYEEARHFFAEAIDVLEQDPDVSMLLGTAYWSMADAWLLQERIPEAMPWLERAIDIFIELEGPDFYGLQLPYSSYGWAQQASGNYSAALENFERAYNVVLRNFGTEHPSAANELNNIAMAMNRLGRYDEAVAGYAKAIDLRRRTTPESDHYRLAGMYSNLGNANANRGQMTLATQNYRDGLDAVALVDPPDARMSAYLENNLGRHLIDVGEVASGIEHLERSIQIKTEIFGADSVSTARSKLLLIKGLLRASNLERAGALLSEAAAVYSREYQELPERLSLLIETEAAVELARGRPDSALELYIDAYNKKTAKTDVDPGELAESVVYVAGVLTRQGRTVEALSWLSRGDDAFQRLSSSHLSRIEAGLLSLENGRIGLDSVSQLRQTVFEQYPARTDWLDRLDAVSN